MKEINCSICGKPITETGTAYKGEPCHIECYHAIKEANEVCTTKESATAYLESQGVDVDALLKRGLARIKAAQTSEEIKEIGKKGYNQLRKTLRFGDVILNGWTDERNPHYKSYVVRVDKETIECTDGNGSFWRLRFRESSKIRIVKSCQMLNNEQSVQECDATEA